MAVSDSSLFRFDVRKVVPIGDPTVLNTGGMESSGGMESICETLYVYRSTSNMLAKKKHLAKYLVEVASLPETN